MSSSSSSYLGPKEMLAMFMNGLTRYLAVYATLYSQLEPSDSSSELSGHTALALSSEPSMGLSLFSSGLAFGGFLLTQSPLVSAAETETGELQNPFIRLKPAVLLGDEFKTFSQNAFINPMISALFFPESKYDEKGFCAGLTTLVKLLDATELRNFHHEAEVFLQPLSPIYAELRAVAKEIFEARKALATATETKKISLKRNLEQLDQKNQGVTSRLFKKVWRGHSFSRKMQTLLAFVCNDNRDPTLRQYCSLSSNRTGEPLLLKLRSGESLEASSPQELLDQLWLKRPTNLRYLGIGPAEDYLPRLNEFMHPGDVYEFEARKHSMILQYTGEEFVLFDPNKGIFKAIDPIDLMEPLEYLRTNGEGDEHLTLSLSVEAEGLDPEVRLSFVLPKDVGAIRVWLAKAITHNDFLMLEACLEVLPPEIKTEPFEGKSWLGHAATFGHWEMLETLHLEYGFPIQADLLVSIVERNRVQMLQDLLADSRFHIDLNVESPTPGGVGLSLMKALHLDRIEIFELLVNAGARINSKGDLYHNPLMYAIQNKKKQALEILLTREDLELIVTRTLPDGKIIPLDLVVIAKHFGNPAISTMIRKEMERREAFVGAEL